MKPVFLLQYPVPTGTQGNAQKGDRTFSLTRIPWGKNDSEWVTLSFAQRKPKSNQVCFISDFMSFNKKIKTRTITYAKNKLNVIEIGGFSV